MSNPSKSCYNKSLNYKSIKNNLSDILYDDGSLKYGLLQMFQLTSRIVKLQNSNKTIKPIWWQCKNWLITPKNEYSDVINDCDLSGNSYGQLNIKRHIRVLIENHPSMLSVKNYSNEDFTHPLSHTTRCKELLIENSNKTQQKLQICSGMAIHLLDMLSKELNIDFSYYYRTKLSKDSIDTASDLIMNNNIQVLILKISMDLLKYQFLDITEPFNFWEYAVMADLHSPHQLLGAAFRPFTPLVWLMISVIATVCAIAMAFYEWHSPFGLNPWGRQRGINYSLASALTSVYAMLFGHTIHTKAPKSWPVKVLKNFWACACIVIVAMYTANLTVFIAGILKNDLCYYYKDNQFKAVIKRELEVITKNIGHYNCLNLTKQSIIVAKTDAEVQSMFLNKSAQIIIGERHILEQFRYENELCKSVIIPLRLNSFGFSFAFRPNSPLYNEVTKLMIEIQKIGFMDVLTKTYIKKTPQKCSVTKVYTQRGYDIENMLGCFLFMGVGFVVALLVLFLEHLLFQFIVPYWRKLPANSPWKGLSMLFFSQRLHRVIHSERLIRPKETTREMIAIVRNREFHKIFFKENMHKPIPTRITSPAKISVYDISSEMVKMKRRSIESLAAYESCSIDDIDSGEHKISIDKQELAPLASISDDDECSINQEPSNNSNLLCVKDTNICRASYTHLKWAVRNHGHSSGSTIQLGSSGSGSTDSTGPPRSKKYIKNPKMKIITYANTQSNCCVNDTDSHWSQRRRSLERMKCLDDDDDDDNENEEIIRNKLLVS